MRIRAVTVATSRGEVSHSSLCATAQGTVLSEFAALVLTGVAGRGSFSTIGIAMRRWRWALLLFELGLFALILVLPQVDLPDFTFHGGTAPAAARARLSSAPERIAVHASLLVEPASLPGEAPVERHLSPSPHDLGCRLSLLCSLLC